MPEEEEFVVAAAIASADKFGIAAVVEAEEGSVLYSVEWQVLQVGAE